MKSDPIYPHNRIIEASGRGQREKRERELKIPGTSQISSLCAYNNLVSKSYCPHFKWGKGLAWKGTASQGQPVPGQARLTWSLCRFPHRALPLAASVLLH